MDHVVTNEADKQLRKADLSFLFAILR